MSEGYSKTEAALKIFQILIFLFFLGFLLLFAGEYGFENIIFEATNRWELLFNLCVWFILVTVCIDKIFGEKSRDGG